ncbi:MAG: hypothetical protein ACTTKX_03990 [Treponema sp.]
MRLRAGEQPAPDLQCAEAHEYKNFLATPAHNLEKAGLRLTKQKSGERANDGRATCAGLQGRAAARCRMNEVNGAMEAEVGTPKSRLRDAFVP